MVWMVVLLACSRGLCDTRPEDLVVEDPDGIASEEGLAAARAGLDDFREWTARDAICLREIRFVESLERQRGFEEDFDPAGRFDGERVLLEDHGAQTRGIVRHELCHALDATEDLSERNADVFSAAADRDGPYPEEKRVPEAFARACGKGPSYGIEEALAEECGLGIEADPAAEFLHREVYRGYDATVDIVAGGLEVAWTPMPETAPDWYIGGNMVATWGGLAGTLVRSDRVINDKLWMLAMDGSVAAEREAGTAVEYLYPVPWNQGAAYIAVSQESSPRVLGTDGTVRHAPGLGDSAQVVWDDVVFARPEFEVVGRDLWTGEAVELGIDTAWWSEYGGSTWAQPAGDAVLVWSPSQGDGWVGTPASGWTWTDDPDHAGLSVDDVTIGREYVITADEEVDDLSVLVGVGPDGKVYTLAEACDELSGELASVDGAPWVVDTYGGRFGRVVLAP